MMIYALEDIPHGAIVCADESDYYQVATFKAGDLVKIRRSAPDSANFGRIIVMFNGPLSEPVRASSILTPGPNSIYPSNRTGIAEKGYDAIALPAGPFGGRRFISLDLDKPAEHDGEVIITRWLAKYARDASDMTCGAYLTPDRSTLRKGTPAILCTSGVRPIRWDGSASPVLGDVAVTGPNGGARSIAPSDTSADTIGIIASSDARDGTVMIDLDFKKSS